MEDEIKAGWPGVTGIRQLPDGRWIAVVPMLFTRALCVEIDGVSYKTRYCYPDPEHATIAAKFWDGVGDPPGNWIVQKPQDRRNPNYVG